MKKPTILERKIRYFFARYQLPLDLEAFEILMLSEFDENNKLVLQPVNEKMKKKYLAYWNKVCSGNLGVSQKSQ